MMPVFTTLIAAMASWVYAYVKAYQIDFLKYVLFILYQLYLNKTFLKVIPTSIWVFEVWVVYLGAHVQLGVGKEDLELEGEVGDEKLEEFWTLSLSELLIWSIRAASHYPQGISVCDKNCECIMGWG